MKQLLTYSLLNVSAFANLTPVITAAVSNGLTGQSIDYDITDNGTLNSLTPIADLLESERITSFTWCNNKIQPGASATVPTTERVAVELSLYSFNQFDSRVNPYQYENIGLTECLTMRKTDESDEVVAMEFMMNKIAGSSDRMIDVFRFKTYNGIYYGPSSYFTSETDPLFVSVPLLGPFMGFKSTWTTLG